MSARIKVEGACWDCSEPTKEGRARCKSCLANAKERARRRYEYKTKRVREHIQLDLFDEE